MLIFKCSKQEVVFSFHFLFQFQKLPGSKSSSGRGVLKPPKRPTTTTTTQQISHSLGIRPFRRKSSWECWNQTISRPNVNAGNPTMNLLMFSYLTWPMAKRLKIFGITYLVDKIKFKLLFQGPLAKWVIVKVRCFFQSSWSFMIYTPLVFMAGIWSHAMILFVPWGWIPTAAMAVWVASMCTMPVLLGWYVPMIRAKSSSNVQ